MSGDKFLEIFSDSKGQLSSTRILAMISMIVGSVILLGLLAGLFFDKSSNGLLGAGTTLVGFAIGGKIGGKALENRNP